MLLLEQSKRLISTEYKIMVAIINIAGTTNNVAEIFFTSIIIPDAIIITITNKSTNEVALLSTQNLIK
jgi:hypothetical protein